VEEHRVHFAEIIKGDLNGRNYLRGIHEVPRIVIYCRRERSFLVVVSFFGCKLRGRIEPKDLVQQGHWITHLFHISRFQEVKGRNLCSETREITKGEVPK
jgi:hypothetical protein